MIHPTAQAAVQIVGIMQNDGLWCARRDRRALFLLAMMRQDGVDHAHTQLLRKPLNPRDRSIHVRSTNHHGTIKLWLRAENDLENRMDCYEAFCDFEVEETGEVGTGTAEYSVMPVWPQWLV